jgi:hypothetical protein
MEKTYLKLQPSEVAITQSAAQIYAAYIIAGKVAEGEEDAWMERSINEAIRIADSVDRSVIAGDEVDSNETSGGLRRQGTTFRGKHD